MSSPRRSARLARRWDRRAPTWDSRSAGAERHLLGPPRAWVCGRARGATLEVGVGTGANLRHYGPDVVLTGVDLSAGMLAEAEGAARRTGREIDLRVAGADDLPFDDETFDAVVLTFVLCSVPSVRAALAESLRVLRPGGELLLADHVRSSSWPMALLMRGVDLASGPLFGEYFARRPLDQLEATGAAVVDTQRTKRLTPIESVHARRSVSTRDVDPTAGPGLRRRGRLAGWLPTRLWTGSTSTRR
ncbi:MAG: class I SAM-dependent methyltransferase [Actinomycetaceae bacterium]